MKLVQLRDSIVVRNTVLRYDQLDRRSAMELQIVLQQAGYYQGLLDGIPGARTAKALAEFKKDSYLTDPELIGAGTVKLLENLANKASLSEQGSLGKIELNPQAGKHTGKSIVLPNKVRVHANEWIVSGVPLTWGEMTKELTRVPDSETVVKNIIAIAKEFGWVRQKINQPLKITSGYRPPHLKIGAEKSFHKVGLAIDVRTMDLKDIYKLWEVMAQSKFIGLGRGMKHGFAHADLGYRKGAKRVVFNY